MQDHATPHAALPEEVLAKVKAIQIRARHLVSDAMAGEYESAFKGRGMEFEEVREYRPGDDIRHIDWNVTARTGAPYVKEHREERELTVMLLVDVSASGQFGTHKKLKNEVAAEVAAVLAYTAIRNNDRVGLIIFSDRVEHYIPPKKGRAHVWRVIREILAFESPRRSATDLAGAMEYLGKVLRRRAVVFVVSDFLDQGYSERLSVLARRHDVTGIVVTDPRELELPSIGILELEDAETGEAVLVDTSNAPARREFLNLGRDHLRGLAELFRAAGIGEVHVRTNEPYVEPIVRFFRTRERRRR